MIDTLSPLGDVWLSDPVNRHHPLNEGRSGWWLSLPGLDGGRQMFDLVGRFPLALTSMGNASNGWRSTSQPGGSGSLLLDGTAGYLLSDPVGTAAGGVSLLGAKSVAVAAWVNIVAYPGAGSSNIADILGIDNAASANSRYLLRCQTTDKFAFMVNNGSEQVIASTSSAPLATWARVLGVWTGANQYLFVNGLQAATKATSGTIIAPNSFGVSAGATAGGARPLSGSLNDLSIWSGNPTAISNPAAFAWADYELSRSGYPGVLNRMGRSVAVGAIGGGGTSVSFAATLADQALASGVTTAAPPSQTVAFAATIADQALASSVAVASPSARTVAFAATVADQSLASSIAVAAPPSRTFSFAATLADQSLSSSATATAPGGRTVAFAGTLGDQSLSSSIATFAPPSRTVAFASTLGNQALASGVTTAAPGTITATFAATVGNQALTSSVAPAVPPSRTVAFASTLGAQSLASSIVAAGPGNVTVAFAGTVGNQSVASSVSVAGASGGGGNFAGSVLDLDGLWMPFVVSIDVPFVFPIDVPNGIRDRFLATSGVTWITGGMTEGLVDEEIESDFYISFHDITSSPIYVAGWPVYSIDAVFQFECFAPTRHEARKMSDLLVDIYHPLADNIPTQAGLVFGMNAMPGGGMDDAGIVSRSGRPLYKFTRDFLFSVSRTRPSP